MFFVTQIDWYFAGHLFQTGLMLLWLSKLHSCAGTGKWKRLTCLDRYIRAYNTLLLLCLRFHCCLYPYREWKCHCARLCVFPVLIYAVFRYLLNLFCYLFPGYLLEYRFRFFSAYIVPFHDNFCGWVVSGGSLLCATVFAHKILLLYIKIERIDLFSIRSDAMLLIQLWLW